MNFIETKQGEEVFMNYKLLHQTAALNETVYDGSVEQSLDCDLTLPDYCPVIQRILKCRVTPQISAYQFVGDRLTVDGCAQIRLYYSDEGNKCVRCYEYSLPYSKSVDMNNINENACISVSADMQYVNCRAVSQRRVDIHGAFSIKIKITVLHSEEFIVGVEGGGMELQKKPMTISSISGEIRRQFSISEVLEVGASKPAVQQIIRSSATAILRDYKVITNKLLVKGELLVKTLYSADSTESALETMENSIPISQIIDMEGVDDTSTCDVRLSVLSFELQTKADSSGEIRLIEAAAKVSAGICAAKNISIDCITDAYSTQFEMQLQRKAFTFERLAETFRDTALCRKTVEIGSVSSILDVWCDSISPSVLQEENAVVIRGNAVVSMFAISTDGSPMYVERTLDFEYKRELKISGEAVRCNPNVNIVGADYSLNGSQNLDVRLEISVDASVFVTESCSLISGVEVDENTLKNSSGAAALTIYFAESGERIWNIARSYNTTVSAIMEENELKEEVVREKCMLLIPCV